MSFIGCLVGENTLNRSTQKLQNFARGHNLVPRLSCITLRDFDYITSQMPQKVATKGSHEGERQQYTQYTLSQMYTFTCTTGVLTTSLRECAAPVHG